MTTETGHRDPEQRERRADARKLREGRPEVRHQHGRDRERRPADPEPLPDEVEQAPPGRKAEPSADLLGHEQRQHARQNHPEQGVPELRTDDRVGRDPAGVVVGEAAHKTRPEHRQERQLWKLDACDPARSRNGQPAPTASPTATKELHPLLHPPSSQRSRLRARTVVNARSARATSRAQARVFDPYCQVALAHLRASLPRPKRTRFPSRSGILVLRRSTVPAWS